MLRESWLNMAENLQNFIEQLWPPGSVAHPCHQAEVAERCSCDVNFLVRQNRACGRRRQRLRRQRLPFGGVEAREPLMRAGAQVVAHMAVRPAKGADGRPVRLSKYPAVSVFVPGRIIAARGRKRNY